ncbi:hypothetical protein V6N12_050837 [Hibiscus sabdariffa]|uniref:Uncharacterized protein n=1 Tax=Hibiscus sabdariffa TaxID=183260 RepID=A0ABR2GEL5_9ROSI
MTQNKLNSTVQEFISKGLQAAAKNEEFLEGQLEYEPNSTNANPSASCEPIQLERETNFMNPNPYVSCGPIERGFELKFVCTKVNQSSGIVSRFYSHTCEPISSKRTYWRPVDAK